MHRNRAFDLKKPVFFGAWLFWELIFRFSLQEAVSFEVTTALV